MNIRADDGIVGLGLLAGQGADLLHPVRRRFIRVQGRGVHYLRAGVGPPVVLLHAGMASARAMLPLLMQLASDHTVFAFDHPGYGDSDSLPKRTIRIVDVADALNATLVALRMPRCPVYGSHSGGAVALELGRRHSACTSAVVVEGPTAFRPREAKFFVSDDYLPPFTVKDDGSHLFADWVKMRDLVTWFPWSKRAANKRLSWPFPSPNDMHERFVDRLRAGDGYRAVYGAAFQFDAREAAAALTVPATFMAHADDLLFSHLDRLPKPKPNQCIRRYPADSGAHSDATAQVLRGYRLPAKAPADPLFRPTVGAINRRYVDLAGGQILVRSAGEGGSGNPLLLLHDGRASSRMLQPLMPGLARRRAVYALDMPDNGASDSLAAHRPSIGDYADAVADTAAVLRLAHCDIYAIGAGAAVALNLLKRSQFAKARAVLETPDFYSPPIARRLAREWVPPLAPEWDGAHLNRLWLMLRDEYAFWPWFDKSPAAACAVDTPSEWQEVHHRITDVLRSLPTYHRLTAAALRYDWAAALRRAGKGAARLAATADDPRRPHAEAAARLARLPRVAVLPAAADEKAREILRLLRG